MAETKYVTTVTLADGTTLRGEVDRRDFVRYEEHRLKAGWPSIQSNEAGLLLQSYVAWSALQRSQQLNGMKLDQFMADAVDITDEEGQPVNPTDGEPGNGSP